MSPNSFRHSLARGKPPPIRGLQVVLPPYTSVPPLRDLSDYPRLQKERTAGAVVIVSLDIAGLVEEPASVLRSLRVIRRQRFDCAMVGRVLGEIRPAHATVLQRFGGTGLRAFIPQDFTRSVLREALRQAGLTGEDVFLWMRMVFEGDRRAQATARMLAAVLTGEKSWNTLAVQIQNLPKRLPSAHQWRMMGKILQPLHQLQTRPGMTVESAAVASPYYDASGFHRACRSLLGLTPAQIGSRLGWEWILWEFLRRKAR